MSGNFKGSAVSANASEWSPFFSGQNKRQTYLILDLGGDYSISLLKIWTRADCCDESLIGAQVRAQDAYGSFFWTTTLQTYSTMYSIIGDSHYPDTDMVGVQYINITGTSGKILTLAEIEVYALGGIRVPIRSFTASAKDVNALTVLYNCIDGNAATFCQTAIGRPPFFYIDLETPVDIQKVVIRNRRPVHDSLLGATISYFSSEKKLMAKYTLGSVVAQESYTLPDEPTCDFGYFRSSETGQCTLCTYTF